MSVLRRLFEIARSQVPNRAPSEPLSPGFPAANRSSTDADAVPSGATVPSKEAGYYANLELKPGASHREIKEAYRNLQRRYHPDHHHKNPEQTALALEITKGLNEAMDYFEKKFAGERA